MAKRARRFGRFIRNTIPLGTKGTKDRWLSVARGLWRAIRDTIPNKPGSPVKDEKGLFRRSVNNRPGGGVRDRLLAFFAGAVLGHLLNTRLRRIG